MAGMRWRVSTEHDWLGGKWEDYNARFPYLEVLHEVNPPVQRSAAFRRQLASELKLWLAEGLVTQGQAEVLDRRYDLAEASAPRVGAFAGALYGLGALLVGGGVIAFVAANWGGIPDLVKVVGLLATMVLFQGVGFHWMEHGPRRLLGHALLIIGVVLFGANVGLFGQIFPTGGNWSSGFGVWAVACTLVSYATGSVPVALLGLMASGTAYFGGLEENVVRGAFPIIVGVQALPFGIKYRSRTTLFFGLMLFAATLATGSAFHSGGVLAVCSVLVSGMLFTFVGFTLQMEERWQPLARVFLLCAGLCVCGVLYLTSIGFVSDGLLRFDRPLHYDRGFAPLLTGLFGILSLIWLGPTLRNAGRAPELVPLMGALVGASLVTLISLLSGSDFVVWIVSAVTFAAASLAMVWHGLNQRDKLFYALGVFALGSRLLLFFFFFSNDLAVKALFMVVGGVAVLFVGLQYEKWANRLAAQGRGEQP